jgi:TrpR-related protein YerC/YecD
MLNSKINDECTDKLFEAILHLKDIEECYNFFEDICTVAEIKSIAQRLEVAKMLDRRNTYSEISEKTGASTATISRVNRALHYGADGYSTIIKRINEKGKSEDNNL